MSGLVAEDKNGKWMLGADDDCTIAREVDRSITINDKLFVIDLKGQKLKIGVSKDLQGDRGEQWLPYK